MGSAVLDVIKEDKLQENSHEVGTLFLEELAKMRDEYPVCILYPYVQYYLLDIKNILLLINRLTHFSSIEHR